LRLALTAGGAQISPVMAIREVKPDVDRSRVLAGAQFADAFRVAVADANLDARGAAERIFSRSPRWVRALMDLRNRIVASFGLKTSAEREVKAGGMVGMFPVLSETPERLVAGFNDHHLDFRVVVDVVATGEVREVTATTLVLTHNWLGRTYLAIIHPFHRLIVKAMLEQVCEA
jgi:hypothetical protein